MQEPSMVSTTCDTNEAVGIKDIFDKQCWGKASVVHVTQRILKILTWSYIK